MWCLGLVAKDMVKLSKSNKLKFRSRILPYKKFNVELLQFGRYGPPYPFHQVDPDKPQIVTGSTHEDEYPRMAVALRDLLPTTNENSDIVKEYHWQDETLARKTYGINDDGI